MGSGSLGSAQLGAYRIGVANVQQIREPAQEVRFMRIRMTVRIRGRPQQLEHADALWLVKRLVQALGKAVEVVRIFRTLPCKLEQLDEFVLGEVELRSQDLHHRALLGLIQTPIGPGHFDQQHGRCQLEGVLAAVVRRRRSLQGFEQSGEDAQHRGSVGVTERGFKRTGPLGVSSRVFDDKPGEDRVRLKLLKSTVGFLLLLAAQPLPAQTDAQATADVIKDEVAELRGLPFKRPVGVERQSSEAFAAYVAARIDEEMPQPLRSHYGKLVRTLGLYRGPEIQDFSSLMTSVLVSQAGAYYDPEKQRFFVLMNRMPDLMQGALYSHELYHALQDQHFGLAKYMNLGRRGAALNADQSLARQAVVEGDATYLMTLWMLQKTMRSIPPRPMLAQIIGAQTSLGIEQLRAMLAQPQVAEIMGEDMRDALRATDQIPAFLLDEMVGSYLKGMAFVFAVQERGWAAVDELYTRYPPQSTEQLLHPEKWREHEAATTFEWPAFGKVAALRDWVLLDSDVLGELRWRTVLKEQGVAADAAEAAAAGWGGDRYAVFKGRNSDATLLLLRTSWDSAADAGEFATAYREALTVKYADKAAPTRVVLEGTEVFIVEGGDEGSIDVLLEVVRRARAHN